MLKGSPGLKSYRGYGIPSIGGYVPGGTFYRGERPSDYSNRMLKEKGDPLAQFAGINPEAITGKKPSKETALKMVGGSVLSAPSFTGSASNNIVKFDRTNIKSKSNNLQSLIQNLSTNVYNNQTNVQNIFGNKESKEIKEKKGLFGFFGNLKDTIQLIQFLGSKKNIDKLRENLENLKDTFSESFEAAKMLRKIINKIYKQFSEMKNASPEEGGGNILDGLASLFGLRQGIKGLRGKTEPGVPTAAVTEESGSFISKVLRGMKNPRNLLLGAGAVGIGAAVSGLSQPGENADIQPAEGQGPEVPETILDRFNSILDRFDKAIDGLKKAAAPSSSSKPPGAQQGSGGGGGAPPGPPTQNQGLMGGPGIEGLSSFIGKAETTGERFDAYNADSGKGDPKILDTNISDLRSYISKYSNSSGAVGAYQFMPETAEGLARQMGMDPAKTKFTPEIQKKLHLFHLNQLGYGKFVKGEMTKEDFGAAIAKQYRAVPDPRTGYTWSDRASVRNRAQVTNQQYLNALELSKQAASQIEAPGTQAPSEARVISSKKIGQDTYTEREGGVYTKNGQSITKEEYDRVVSSSSSSTVSAVVQPYVTETAYGPPLSSSGGAPKTNIINIPGISQPPSSSSNPGSGIVAPAPPSQPGPTASMGSAYNSDNFMTLSSRIRYSLVS